MPEEPVISRKSGHLFEKRLIDKFVSETGKCPVTNEPLSDEDLLPLKVNKALKPRVAPAASIPGLLGLFHNEWDALMLENHTLRQQLTANRQELAQALYQHDAACRVIARLQQERDEARDALAAVQATGGKRRAEDAAEGAADKRAKMEVIPSEVLQAMIARSAELSAQRKKHKISPTLATGEALSKYKAESRPLHTTRKGGIRALDMAPGSSSLLASGGDDKSVNLMDVEAETVVAKLAGHAGAVTSVRFLGGASRLVSGSADGSVRLWAEEASEGERTWGCTATLSHGAEVVAALAHPTGAHVVSVGKDGTWKVWDAALGEEVASVAEPSLNGAAYSAGELHPDGLILGCGTSDGLVRLFDLRTQGKEAARFPAAGGEGHRGAVSSMSFSENGYLLATAADDGVRVWDLRKLKCVKHIETEGPALMVRFDPTGGYLAIGSAGKVVLVAPKQEYATVREFADLGSKGRGGAVAFGVDASVVAVGSADHNLRVYSARAGK